MRNSIFETLAAMTYPYGIMPEDREPTHTECEHCGAFTTEPCVKVSNCCGRRPATEADELMEICSRCGEHCEYECEKEA